MGAQTDRQGPGAVITLEHPVTFAGERIESLTLKRLKGKHLRSVGGDATLGMMLDLAVRLSGQPPEVIDELEAEDAAKVIKVISGFLAPFQEDGAKVSPSSPTASNGRPASS